MADLSGLYFYIDKSDIFVSDEVGYIFKGWLLQTGSDLKDLRVLGDDSEEIPSEAEFYERADVKTAFQELNVQDKPGFAVSVKNFDRYAVKYKKIGLYVFYGNERKLLEEVQVDYILPFTTEESAEYRIEKVEIAENRIRIIGWAVNRLKKQAAGLFLTDMNWKRVDTRIERFPRPDVNDYCGVTMEEVPCAGFEVRARYKDYRDSKLCLRIRFDINVYKDCMIDISQMYKDIPSKSSVKRFKDNKLLKEKFEGKYGKEAYLKYISYLDSERDCAEYMMWNMLNGCGERELSKQAEQQFEIMPLISVVMPLYNTPADYLNAAINSIMGQSYKKFELCLADGSSDDSVREHVMSFCKNDERVKYIKLEKNLGISANTNEAIKCAAGEYIVFADHDDVVTPDALYEIVSLINKTNGTAEVIYSSEDKLSADGKYIFNPVIKQKFNPDFLRCQNYMCHIIAVKKDLLEKTGLLQPKYDGAQEHDMLIICMEHTDQVNYKPKVLYHWRQHSGSASSDIESGETAKSYAYDAGKQAVRDHYRRLGYGADVSDTEIVGIYHSAIRSAEDLKISAVILNKDGNNAEKCVESIKNSGYENIEIIMPEYTGNDAETLNKGIREASGDYIFTIDSGLEIISGKFFEELLGYCGRKDTGIVGAKIYDNGGNALHMGFTLGETMIPHAAKIDEDRRYPFNYIVQDMYAVSASCFMMKKSFFEGAGGFDEKLTGILMSADICMKAREEGYLTVFDPFAKVRYSVQKNEADQVNEDQADYFKDKWSGELPNGDPYYVKTPDLTQIDFAAPEIDF